MATTTQLIQKYKTIQKSTSSVPTVLYLKLRLFLTDSDRMCDSDILTIYPCAKLAQASLTAYGSDSPGREFWPKCGPFLKKVEPSCDQTL